MEKKFKELFNKNENNVIEINEEDNQNCFLNANNKEKVVKYNKICEEIKYLDKLTKSEEDFILSHKRRLLSDENSNKKSTKSKKNASNQFKANKNDNIYPNIYEIIDTIIENTPEIDPIKELQELLKVDLKCKYEKKEKKEKKENFKQTIDENKSDLFSVENLEPFSGMNNNNKINFEPLPNQNCNNNFRKDSFFSDFSYPNIFNNDNIFE